MARRADREKDIDAGTAKQSRKASKSDRKHRKARIFTSDICLFYAKMNHHLELFNPFFFLYSKWHFQQEPEPSRGHSPAVTKQKKSMQDQGI